LDFARGDRALAGFPLVIFALSQGLWTGVIFGVLFVTYRTLSNHLLGPLIVGKTLRISPPTSLIAVLIGVSLAGFIGGFLATPVVALVQALSTYRDPVPGASVAWATVGSPADS
jgi:predicted PurR-regulated permease PerM